MSTDLEKLEPALVWSYFLALSAIPRASKQEAAAAAWCVAQGRALGLEVETDAVGNVLIRKPGSPGHEGAPTVGMQAHIDMVCEKNEGTEHDFTRDPIRVRRDGDFLRATGTTLGADDGIGVAVGLAALATPGLVHPPRELLLTLDEETGLTGANELRAGWMRAKYLLNLDSEAEGFLTVGCAGGVDNELRRNVTWGPAPAGVALRVRVHGAKGGHSGGDIHLGRANAIRVLAQVLAAVDVPWRLASLGGGNKRNALPREAAAVVVVAAADEARLRSVVTTQAAMWRDTYGAFDPGVTASVDAATATRVASVADGLALVRLLLAVPHGVAEMSPAIADLVQTSTNLGVVHTDEAGFEVVMLTRSSIEANKLALCDRIEAIGALAGFECARVGGYPGWKPVPDAPLVGVARDAWRACSGRDLEVIAIHAGLECGLIGEKYPGMQMVSFGPDVADAHTPEERVSIPSTARFWELLVEVLRRLATAA